MTGVGRRQRAAIMAGFVVQATLIAVALGLPAELSARGSATSGAVFTMPDPVALAGQAVTVDVSGQVGNVAYPLRGTAPQPQFTVRADSDASVTITISNADPASASPALITISDGAMGDGEQVLAKVGTPPVGRVTFTVTVPATDLKPGSDAMIRMAEVGPYGNRVESPIADLLAS